jgi:NAD(P)-dependent dehydrogenase (short-subunit alcohol dehydrogenase family)
MRPLEGATSLVTGGAQGIGAAAARLLASRGSTVVVADVNRTAGQEVAGEIGGRFVDLDVANPAAWGSIPPVDYAFLNAGTMTKSSPCSVDDLTLDSWTRVRSVNVDGVVHGLLHLLSGMAEAGGGSIVLSGSLAGLASYPPDPFYAASKSLVISLARSLGDQAAATSVRVNALCPGEVATALLPPDRAQLLASKGYRPPRSGRSGGGRGGDPRGRGKRAGLVDRLGATQGDLDFSGHSTARQNVNVRRP